MFPVPTTFQTFLNLKRTVLRYLRRHIAAFLYNAWGSSFTFPLLTFYNWRDILSCSDPKRVSLTVNFSGPCLLAEGNFSMCGDIQVVFFFENW